MATLSASRDYGYTIGDIIEHTITVEAGINPTALPQPGPLNDWLTLRAAEWGTQLIDGREHPAIHLSYQVFKGVQKPESVTIPALPLHMTGSAGDPMETPFWSFTLIPVIPPDLQNEDIDIRAPLAPEPPTLTAVWPRIRLWTCLLALGTALWGIRAYRLNTRVRPFAQACHLMAAHRIPIDANPLEHHTRLLHRALDQTWGETLFLEDVDGLCTLRPEFSHLRNRLIEFFGHSQRLFFDTRPSFETESVTLNWLTDLGRRCAAAERSNP